MHEAVIEFFATMLSTLDPGAMCLRSSRVCAWRAQHVRPGPPPAVPSWLAAPSTATSSTSSAPAPALTAAEVSVMWFLCNLLTTLDPDGTYQVSHVVALFRMHPRPAWPACTPSTVPTSSAVVPFNRQRAHPNPPSGPWTHDFMERNLGADYVSRHQRVTVHHVRYAAVYHRFIDCVSIRDRATAMPLPLQDAVCENYECCKHCRDRLCTVVVGGLVGGPSRKRKSR